MPTIHHDVTFAASPARVYRALMNSAEHAEYTGLPAHIGDAEGETFSLFGGRVIGRHLELVPDQRIVQAWRATHWPDGLYTIVRITLHPEGDQTRLVLDHDAVPDTVAAHVDRHWKTRYWEALTCYLEPW
jgi:activator of HSP90 ATPase